jgi:hypothetical protein
LPRFGGRAVVDLLAAVEAHGLVSRSDGAHDVAARIALVVANLPISERRARLLIEKEGIPGEAVTLKELARAAVRDGGRVPFRIVELGGVKIAVGLSQVTAARIAYRLATRAVRGAGGARIRAIPALLRETPDLAIDVPFVERVLSEVDAFRWIDRREVGSSSSGSPIRCSKS